MSSQPHRVHIALDSAGPFRCGDAITGAVVITATEPETDAVVLVELQLHAEGRVSGVAVLAQQPLHRGPLAAGATYTLRFALTAPPWSGRYQGQLFHLDLRVAALVVLPARHKTFTSELVAALSDVSLAERHARKHAAAACPVAVLPEPRPLDLALDPERTKAALAHRGWKVIGGIALFILGLAAFAVAAAMYVQMIPVSRWIVLPVAIGGICLVIFGPVVLRRNLGEWFAERRIATPQVRLSQRATAAGELLDLEVRLDPGARVTDVTVTFRVRERVTIDQGSSVSYEHHLLGEHELPRCAPAAHGVFAVTVPMETFAGMRPAIGLPSACILWSIFLRIRIPNWPDWEDEIPVEAVPRGRANLPARVFMF